MPKKKALLVGINNYPPPADILEAPVRETKKWAKLLEEQHSFDKADIRILPEADATRQGVLDALRELLDQASKDDFLFFGFGGHGAEVNGWLSDVQPSQIKEHGLIVYATPQGDQTFQNASITPSDIARLLEEKKPPADAQFVIGLDSCFAAAFGGSDGDSPPLINPKALVIPDAVKGLGDEKARTFAEIRGLISDPNIASPMIVAAAEVDQTAIEDGPPLDRRLLYSKRAITRLKEAFYAEEEISTRVLVDEINPLRKDEQEATIVGNTTPQDDPFGGGFPAPQTPSVLVANVATTTTAPFSFEIRIIGLVTFITQPDGEPYRTRMVLPFDTFKPPHSPEHHFGFIEVADQDMPAPPVGTVPRRYLRAGVKYSRWPIKGHTVRIANVPATNQPVKPSQQFVDHVPGLTKTAPELKDYPDPRTECFDDYPRTGVINGFIDLQAGDITIGELESEKTTFKGLHTGTIHRPAEFTPICVRLTVPLDQSYAAITLENAAGHRTVIYVRSGAVIVAGNAREADITGPGSGEGPREHFAVYYNLSAKQPVFDGGLPEKPLIPINACTVTTYP